MNKFLQKINSFKLEEVFSIQKQKVLSFINMHPNIFCLGVLLLTCTLFLFFGLGNYPLLDVDESRYAVMARDLIASGDWNSLMLNGVPFLEKPPLYFWLVAASVKMFHGFSPFAVRFPIAILTMLLIFATYYVGERVISRKFGMISALTLLSSVFFLILSHVAILDMVLTVFVALTLYSGFLTHFCEAKNKKFYWLAFYIFMGFGFLSKGILAIAIPFTVMFVYNLLTKTLKDIFKPINFIPGIILFLIISMPWHVLMYQKYGNFFIQEYIIKHHFARFINSVSIGRERPLLYFVPVFLMGFMPWTFVFIAFLIDGFKKLKTKFTQADGNILHKLFAVVDAKNNEQKLMLFASLSFAIIFAVFSSSSTKLPTYILPAFPFAALMMGYYWWIADERSEHEKAIYNSSMILASLLLIASIGAFIAFFFLPADLQYKLEMIKHITITNFYLLVILMMLRLNTKRALSIFSSYLFLMLTVIIISSFCIFNFVYSTGQNEIVNYSRISYHANGKETQLVTFDFAVKPSVLINKDKQDNLVEFITDPEFDKLDKILNTQKTKAAQTFVIVKNKNFMNNPAYQKELEKRLKPIIIGEKYSLFSK